MVHSIDVHNICAQKAASSKQLTETNEAPNDIHIWRLPVQTLAHEILDMSDISGHFSDAATTKWQIVCQTLAALNDQTCKIHHWDVRHVFRRCQMSDTSENQRPFLSIGNWRLQFQTLANKWKSAWADMFEIAPFQGTISVDSRCVGNRTHETSAGVTVCQPRMRCRCVPCGTNAERVFNVITWYDDCDMLSHQGV